MNFVLRIFWCGLPWQTLLPWLKLLFGADWFESLCSGWKCPFFFLVLKKHSCTYTKAGRCGLVYQSLMHFICHRVEGLYACGYAVPHLPPDWGDKFTLVYGVSLLLKLTFFVSFFVSLHSTSQGRHMYSPHQFMATESGEEKRFSSAYSPVFRWVKWNRYILMQFMNT